MTTYRKLVVTFLILFNTLYNDESKLESIYQDLITIIRDPENGTPGSWLERCQQSQNNVESRFDGQSGPRQFIQNYLRHIDSDKLPILWRDITHDLFHNLNKPRFDIEAARSQFVKAHRKDFPNQYTK